MYSLLPSPPTPTMVHPPVQFRTGRKKYTLLDNTCARMIFLLHLYLLLRGRRAGRGLYRVGRLFSVRRGASQNCCCHASTPAQRVDAIQLNSGRTAGPYPQAGSRLAILPPPTCLVPGWDSTPGRLVELLAGDHLRDNIGYRRLCPSTGRRQVRTANRFQLPVPFHWAHGGSWHLTSPMGSCADRLSPFRTGREALARRCWFELTYRPRGWTLDLPCFLTYHICDVTPPSNYAQLKRDTARCCANLRRAAHYHSLAPYYHQPLFIAPITRHCPFNGSTLDIPPPKGIPAFLVRRRSAHTHPTQCPSCHPPTGSPPLLQDWWH